MTLRQKLLHVHNRLGFGATPAELDLDEKLGLDTTLERLIDYEKVNEDFAVSPWEFCWRDSTKEDADIGSYRLRLWWAFRMLCTKRPLQEKLTLFWSGHFAADDDKVEDGPMMLDYIDGLRENANSNFRNLLDMISKSPAMMRYLDMTHSLRGDPNENFPREVMELFTLGIDGGYTEKDVKEIARALTGWGYVHVMYELPGDMKLRLHNAIKFDRPFSSFSYMPAMHDPGPKTILGKTKNWTGDEVLDLLASHPSTARFISRKLWTFFAYENPDPATVARISKEFARSKGDIKAVLRAIVHSPEFWSDKCVGQQAKSPVDFVIGIARTMGLGQELLKFRAPNATEFTQIDQKIINELGYVTYRMDRMGLLLMNPPDVSGWKWGRHFINPATMPERYQYQGNYLADPGKPDKLAQNTIGWVVAQAPKTNQDVARKFCELFGVPTTTPIVDTLSKVVVSQGGAAGLKDQNHWSGMHWGMMKLLVAAPEMHVW